MSLNWPSGGTKERTRLDSHGLNRTHGWNLTSFNSDVFANNRVKSGNAGRLQFTWISPYASHLLKLPSLHHKRINEVIPGSTNRYQLGEPLNPHCWYFLFINYSLKTLSQQLQQSDRWLIGSLQCYLWNELEKGKKRKERKKENGRREKKMNRLIQASSCSTRLT